MTTQELLFALCLLICGVLCWKAMTIVCHLSVHRFSEAERDRNNVLATFERLFEKTRAPAELAYPLHATHSQERQNMIAADLERAKMVIPDVPYIAPQTVDQPNTEFNQ